MKRWIWGGAATWIGVVAAGSTIAWFAIDSAGRQVTTAPVPTAPRTSVAPSAAPSRPAASPTTGSTIRTRVGSWNGSAGSMTVSCTGRRARLTGATPADGWLAERTGDSGGVRVRFERGESEVIVRATCTTDNGPVFDVENRADDGGSDD
ncbi:MAG: hypothetical protein NTV23_02525 [Propionibacteriales bacterium]|nr:hypothetical protein [Propionibacteriales bacterium]